MSDKLPAFNGDYYKLVLEEGGYENMRDEVKPINFNLNGLTPQDLSMLWFCHYDADKFADIANASREKIMVITGIGLSGVPHLGTLSQMLKAIKLQKYGNLPVKFVLGDLDAFNGKATPMEKAREIGVQTKKFMQEMGFDDSGDNELSDQYEELEILRTMYLVSHFMDDQDFDRAEEDLHGFYASQGKVDSGMTFRRKLSLSLMVAGWYHQQLEKGREHLLITLGIDEHRYVKFAQSVLARIKAHPDFGRKMGDASISAMYSTLIRGFNGYPKMSKSFPGSGITLDMQRKEIVELIMKGEGSYESPENSVVFQCIANASLYCPDEITRAYVACQNGGADWVKTKHEYSEHLADIVDIWRKVNNTVAIQVPKD